MPELSDLLRDAAPPPGPYDEDRVRARVAQRARRRRTALAAAVIVVIVGAYGLVLALNGSDDSAVVTDEPPTTVAPGFTATAVAIVADQIWIGGDGFVALACRRFSTRTSRWVWKSQEPAHLPGRHTQQHQPCDGQDPHVQPRTNRIHV